ncbi:MULTISPECIES: hypothetical protein [Rummeliibacillus]|uniref:hypothetical protein n=1 Tax=Rummeliibacillus TaxID=648802 RepID=UPI0011B7758E|nr:MULTISPECIES: hypothetical protein [Rummeliibacillus]MBO2535242.1 hypothetical protein [Rummeliibacillus suwonensis]
MDSRIEFYVSKIEAEILRNLAEHDNADLYQIAHDLIQYETAERIESICQAYEVVKHELAG